MFSEIDPVILHRIQFALTIMFHYLFPPLSIGLGALLVILEGLYVKTGDYVYKSISQFWTKIFAVNFAMGVATGIVMEFQFGTNWATYSRFVGDIFGSALAAEGIFAFFLESGFLALMVFGWDRISKGLHYFSTWMVFLGSVFSAVWIVIANSWQQTPAGYHIVAHGLRTRAEVTDFWAMVFNPSSMPRLGHVLIGAFILGAFFMMSISAYYILKKIHLAQAKKCFSVALIFATIVSCLQLLAGDTSAKIVAHYQPAKLAALEGHYITGDKGTPLYIWGFPDSKEKKVNLGISVPGMLSFLVYENFDKPVPGLDKFPQDEIPPVPIPFYSYHMMIGLGMAFIGLTLLSVFLLWRGILFENTLLMKLYVVAVIGPYIANETGWVCAEVGRQPWVVYGLLKTKDAISKAVPAAEVMISIAMFTLIYGLLFWVWLFVMHSKIMHGPEDPEHLRLLDQRLSKKDQEKDSPMRVLDSAALLHDPDGYSLVQQEEFHREKPYKEDISDQKETDQGGEA